MLISPRLPMKYRTAAPKVSVTIPTHNIARFLRQSLRSVLAQHDVPFEVIALDDGSSDGTWDILREFASDPRLRLYRWRKNRGIPVARNRLLKLCRGQYLVAHDGDDVMLPHRFADQVDLLDQNSHIGVVFGRLKLLNQQQRRFPPHSFTPAFETPTGWTHLARSGEIPECQKLHFHHSSAMFRVALLQQVGGYDERWGVGEDTDLIRRLLPKTKFYFIHRHCFRYRLRPGSSTDRMRKERVSTVTLGALPFKAQLSIGGTTCMVASDWSEYAQILRDRIPFAFTDEIGARARLHLSLTTGTPHGGWMKAGLAPARVHSLMESGIAREISAQRGTVSIWLDPLRNHSREFIWQHAFIDPLALVATGRHRLLLEAGLVSRGDDDGILIVGTATERSAVTLSLVEQGYRYYSDRLAIVELSASRGIIAFRLPTEIAVAPAVAIHFPSLRDHFRYDEHVNRFFCDVPRIFPNQLGIQCRVRTLLFPKFHASGRFRAWRLPANAVMRSLLRDRYNQVRNAEPHRPGYRRQIDLNMHLAGSLQAFGMNYGGADIENLSTRLASHLS